MPTFTHSAICATLALLILIDRAHGAGPQIIDDFDGATKLSERWSAFGRITVERVPVPGDVKLDGVAGMMIRCEAEPRSALVASKTMTRPAFEQFDTIRFRIQVANATERSPVDFECRVHCADRNASLWRRWSVSNSQWQTINLPMQFFRFSQGANVQWEEAARFGIFFRQNSIVSIDDIQLIAKEEKNPFFEPKELGRLAMGEAARVSEGAHFAIITDEPRLESIKLMRELDQLQKLIARDFPKLAKPVRLVPVLVFRRERDYRAFWQRFSAVHASSSPPIRSDGYSALGVAASFYSEQYGSVRPVLLHEACHAYLAPILGLSNSSEWLHEGLANYYQLQWTKQDVHALTATMIQAHRHRPLRELLGGQRLKTDDYAQATLVMEWLLEEATRKQQLKAAVVEMRRSSSTDLNLLAERYFGQSIADLEKAWLRWAQNQLTEEPTIP